MDLVEVEEGTTRFFVPCQDSSSHFPPGSAPVFYNRRMELNRDGTVLFASVARPSEYLDAMGATGVRGLRIAAECGIPVTINDRDPAACELIQANVMHAGLSIPVRCTNVHLLLAERRYDMVDVDPFGSPAPFLDSAVRGTGRFLLVTATDTAPLCGAHFRAGKRRYFARPLNNEYHAETGLRILLASVVRETVKYDRGIEPLFCYSREHYARAHFRLTNGAAAADRALDRIGYILQCTRCPARVEQQGLVPEQLTCNDCGGPMTPAGPLWLGTIQEQAMVREMAERLPDKVLHTTRPLGMLLAILREEIPTSSHYDYHALAKRAGVSPAPLAAVIFSLRESGYSASRAHYSGTALKTDAPADRILGILRGD